jgi:hypothetical protein
MLKAPIIKDRIFMDVRADNGVCPVNKNGTRTRKTGAP